MCTYSGSMREAEVFVAGPVMSRNTSSASKITVSGTNLSRDVHSLVGVPLSGCQWGTLAKSIKTQLKGFINKFKNKPFFVYFIGDVSFAIHKNRQQRRAS